MSPPLDTTHIRHLREPAALRTCVRKPAFRGSPDPPRSESPASGNRPPQMQSLGVPGSVARPSLVTCAGIRQRRRVAARGTHQDRTVARRGVQGAGPVAASGPDGGSRRVPPRRPKARRQHPPIPEAVHHRTDSRRVDCSAGRRTAVAGPGRFSCRRARRTCRCSCRRGRLPAGGLERVAERIGVEQRSLWSLGKVGSCARRSAPWPGHLLSSNACSPAAELSLWAAVWADR